MNDSTRMITDWANREIDRCKALKQDSDIIPFWDGSIDAFQRISQMAHLAANGTIPDAASKRMIADWADGEIERCKALRQSDDTNTFWDGSIDAFQRITRMLQGMKLRNPRRPLEESYLLRLRAISDAASPGPWGPGHLANDDCPCNCRYIFDLGHLGAIATIHVDDKKGNDAPSLEEAKANMIFIAEARDAVPKLLAEIERLRGN